MEGSGSVWHWAGDFLGGVCEAFGFLGVKLLLYRKARKELPPTSQGEVVSFLKLTGTTK
ncbi:MAG: hypothetical protein WCF22_15725 [Candidatus Sulfotelmatobacter sp.]